MTINTYTHVQYTSITHPKSHHCVDAMVCKSEFLYTMSNNHFEVTKA